MFNEEMSKVSAAAISKIKYMEKAPMGYLLLSALAGAYVGFGIVLIFSIGGPIEAGGGGPFLKLIMGASFGIALSLVIFAGSELFTGNNMVFTIAGLRKQVRTGSIMKLHLLCYLGNFLGSALLALLVVQAGSLAQSSQELILGVTSAKMNAGAKELFLRGILCNWLVCLAVWVSGRTQNDAAKLILIFWCLFAFISCGFEHCVANMTLLSMGMLIPHGAEISMMGFTHNMIWVTLGNIIGGGIFVGMVYSFADSKANPGLAIEEKDEPARNASVAKEPVPVPAKAE